VPPRAPWRRWRAARRLRSRLSLAFFDYLAPTYNVIYPLRVDGPEECGPLAMNEFVFPLFHQMFNVPAYQEWLDTHDFRSVLALHRRQLQLLQNQRPGRRWLLKGPYLIAAVPALLETYPDACLIQTHRDPLKVIPSVCSMWASFRGVSCSRLDAREIGRQVLATMSFDLQRCLDARDTAGPSSFFDLRFADLTGDPMATVKRFYHDAGLELEPQTERAMAEYAARAPRHARGVHRYSLEQFGLTRDTIYKSFGAYYERFNVPKENESH
jgi:hypothetical protein